MTDEGRSRSWWRRLFARPQRQEECDCGEFSHRMSCPYARACVVTGAADLGPYRHVHGDGIACGNPFCDDAPRSLPDDASSQP